MKITTEQIAKAINGPWNIGDFLVADRDKLEQLRDARWKQLSDHEKALKLQEAEAALLEIRSLQRPVSTAKEHARIMLRWQQTGKHTPTKAFSEWVKNNASRIERSHYRKSSRYSGSLIYVIVTLLDDSIYDELVDNDFFGAEMRETDDLDRAWYWVGECRYCWSYRDVQEDENTDPWNFSAQTKRGVILVQTNWEDLMTWQHSGHSDPDFETITPDEIRTEIARNIE